MTQEKTRSAGQVLLIPNEKIFPNPHQPRRVFDQSELVNLAISIRMNGILQPITVRECEKGYELISGERRLRASRLAGMGMVPCIVVDVNEMKSAIFSLIENLQRQNLGYFEEAMAIEQLMQSFSLSQEETARRLGKAPSTISNKLRLLTLPPQAQILLAEHGLSERHARALLRLDEADVLPVLEKVIARELNVAQTEKLVNELLAGKHPSGRTTKRMFSDVRIFLNTISNAFDTMKSAGIDARMEKTETGDAYVYEIRIPKSAVYKNATP
ncbi:MAG: ParB/RepB/Spo0J family partition protein [Clostridia bacterium]|jgi:ParB family chromosome partitioning protein|nr:ParB/RepB/Spo0J family partition protein [Clostridia bacterium]